MRVKNAIYLSLITGVEYSARAAGDAMLQNSRQQKARREFLWIGRWRCTALMLSKLGIQIYGIRRVAPSATGRRTCGVHSASALRIQTFGVWLVLYNVWALPRNGMVT